MLVFGVTALSKYHLHNQMPRTLQFLQSRNAVELLGYNMIEEDTFPNIVPFLSGKSVEEIKKSCWKEEGTFFDKCPFIWNNFSQKGYETGLGEDAGRMGIFQFAKPGFLLQPVDHYFHTMMTSAEFYIGHKMPEDTQICLGPRLAIQVLLAYAEKFATSLKILDTPFFGVFWSRSLTQRMTRIPVQMDVVYENFLRNLAENGVLDNTFVILMSDQGVSWELTKTKQKEYVALRQPFVSILVPSWFQDSYQSAMTNLRNNQLKLVTAFDLHETMMNLLQIHTISNEGLDKKMMKPSPRGESLFLPISNNRTCQQAGIPDKWCSYR